MKTYSLPDGMQQQWLSKKQQFLDTAPEDAVSWFQQIFFEPSLNPPSGDTPNPVYPSQQELAWVWAGSEFVADSCSHKPDMFRELVESGALTANSQQVANPPLADQLWPQLSPLLQGELSDAEVESSLQSLLRQFRNREMVRIIWRDFTRIASMEETTAQMTQLAEACIQGALDVLYPILCRQWGTPMGSPEGVNGLPAPQQMVVLGMGKLGAGELNVSSDIDLIFAYPESGETQFEEGRSGRRTRSNQEFFVRLGQRLIKVLDEITVDGFVFRVDMRLRPYGDSGALVLNFDAMEEYYQTQGRDWERYAMIKARPVAGDKQAGEQLMAMLKPFTYRKYIDFGAVASLRKIKSMIRRELKNHERIHDIKRGEGGIREVEFIAQSFQIIRGGRDPELQTPVLKAVYQRLAQEELISQGEVAALYSAYEFLRNLEHVLQGWQDKQTQLLPEEPQQQQRVAVMMGYADWPAFSMVLQQHRQCISDQFAQVISGEDDADKDEHSDPRLSLAMTLWQGVEQGDFEPEAWLKLGYQQPEDAYEQLRALQQGRAIRVMPRTSRQRLGELIPALMVVCGDYAEEAQTALSRTLSVVQVIARRSAYLALLRENAQVLKLMVNLCAASPWVAEQLARYPVLLDELLDGKTLYELPGRDALQNELQQLLLSVPCEDVEGRLEVLHRFRHSHGLRVASSELSGALPLMKVSDYLTWVAEVIIEEVLALAWQPLQQRHGCPLADDGSQAGFLVIGYGKLGGIELGHGSDLDLVFLHNGNGQRLTDGAKPVDTATFFARLGQKVVHLLSTQMPSGKLYEIDMRLRPSGNAGLLVSSFSAFEKYQREEAWTWEHQALVRARPVAGSAALTERFLSLRQKTLCQSRDLHQLATDVVSMRDKMRDHLDVTKESGSPVFHLKQGAGGIVDIEFMVQFAVLAWCRQRQELAHWSDNIRLLESLAGSGLLPESDVQQLTEAYQLYRSASHRLQLQNASSVLPDTEFTVQRRQVRAIWQRLFNQG